MLYNEELVYRSRKERGNEDQENMEWGFRLKEGKDIKRLLGRKNKNKEGRIMYNVE